MSFVAVMPAIHEPLTMRCIESMCDELRDHLLVVDNTKGGKIAPVARGQARWVEVAKHNSVAAAWNRGLRLAEREQADYLVTVSHGVVFESGGQDFLAMLAGEPVVYSQHGWHLAAVAASVWKQVGRFDVVFGPAYCEDVDYRRRIVLSGIEWPDQVFAHITCEIGQAVHLGLVSIDYAALSERYLAKWGGLAPNETYDHPYNDPSLLLSFTGEHV